MLDCENHFWGKRLFGCDDLYLQMWVKYQSRKIDSGEIYLLRDVCLKTLSSTLFLFRAINFVFLKLFAVFHLLYKHVSRIHTGRMTSPRFRYRIDLDIAMV